MLTDSGGYQVFSLEPKVDDEGATFRVDLRRQHATTSRPEGAVDVQVPLGSDIQMVLDVCPPLPSPARGDPGRGRAHRAVGRAGPQGVPGRTTRPDAQTSSASCRAAIDLALRAESAERTVGDRLRRLRRRRPVGGRGAATRCCPALEAALSRAARPTGPATSWASATRSGIVEAVARGVDMFDCVLPTRLARHGTILTVARAGSTCATAASPTTPARSTRPAAARCAPAGRGATCATCCRCRRAHGAPAADPAQRGLDVRVRRPPPRRDRGGDARRAAGRRGRRVGAGGTGARWQSWCGVALVPRQATFALSRRVRGVARKDAARRTPPANARARTQRAALLAGVAGCQCCLPGH